MFLFHRRNEIEQKQFVIVNCIFAEGDSLTLHKNRYTKTKVRKLFTM